MISVFEPEVTQSDIDAVVAALQRGEISGNFGAALDRFEQEFASFVGCRYGIATSSGTTALHLAVASCNIGAGEEVLVSASTNIATALAPVYCGALPVPADSDPHTWNIDVDRLEESITSRTRAIIPVHLFGHPVDMDALMDFARSKGLIVIEDCAEAHGAKCRGRTVGSFGDFGAFSFYANKIVTTGEGGMLTTNDRHLAERARYLRNVGFGKPRFVHREIGFNYRMTGYQAALGLSQLGRIEEIIAARRELALRYARRLSALPFVEMQTEQAWARHVYWAIAIRLGSEAPGSRDALVDHLAGKGIETRTFFCPMGQQPCLQSLAGFRHVPSPVADDLWNRGLYLPSSPALSDEALDTITNAIADVGSWRT